MRLPCQRSALKRSFLYLYYLIITFFCSLHKEFAKLVFLLTTTKLTGGKVLIYVFLMEDIAIGFSQTNTNLNSFS